MNIISIGKKKLSLVAVLAIPLLGATIPILWPDNPGGVAEKLKSDKSEELAQTQNRHENHALTLDSSLPTVQSGAEGVVTISPSMIQKIGVRTSPVLSESLKRTVRTTGEFFMDEQGVHVISLKVDGWVEKLWADYNGKIVTKGEKLLELYSPELITTQEEYLLALQNSQRLSGADAKAQRDAEQLLDAAKWRLRYWDLTDEQVQLLEETGRPQRTLAFYAPVSGEVMHKAVSEGQYITTGQALMEIVDISSVWLIVDVHEKDLPWVKPGALARIELASQPGKDYVGHIDFIYHMMNSEMRTAKARIILGGGHGSLLKPGTYATAYLQGAPQPMQLVGPEEAVIRTGERQLVIKSLGEGRYALQEVRTGLSSEGKVQILEGLGNGDEIVSSGQFMIDSEARLLGITTSMLGDSPGSGSINLQAPK